MAPTIQTGAASERDRKQKAVEKKSDLVCKVKYSNTLPDIPFDPKFIKYPFQSDRFVQYKPTTLERSYKHDLLTEHDLGVIIDLINPHTYAIDPDAVLHPDDERLLEEDTLTPQDSKRSRHHNKIVPWLKKTEYISNEFNRYGHSSEKTETKVGYNVKKLFKEENMYMDRESQITAINKTFSDAKTPIEKHYSKPGVLPVDILPVFPDFDLWKYPFAQVMFDNDPAPSTQMEEMSQAMIRGVVDESGEQFVAYFLPTEETLKRKRQHEESQDGDSDEEYEFKMAREYNWNVKNKASKGYEENYFFVFRENGVHYNELETRVRLSKRRAKPGMPPNNSVLAVRHRPYTEMEFNHQKARMSQLDPPLPEEEEEEEEEETQEVAEDEEQGEREAGSEAGSEREERSEGEEEETTRKETKSDESEKEAEESDREGSEKAEESDREAEGSDKEGSDKEAEESDREAEGSDKEAEESDKEKADSDAEQSSAKSSSASEKGSSSSSESEDEDAEERQKKRDEEEIFGSDSD